MPLVQIRYPLIAFLAAYAPAVAHGQEGKPPRPEQIIERHVEACGGREAQQKLKNRVMRGKIAFGDHADGTLTAYFEAPSKAYFEVDSESIGQIRRGTDGHIAWEILPGMGARVLEGEELGDAIRQANMMRWVDWKKVYKDAASMGAEEVEGAACWKVRMVTADGAEELCWFERESGLLRKIERSRKHPLSGDDIKITSVLEDYKKVDGVMIAHKSRTTTMGTENKTVWESVKHNVDLPDDRFAIPPEVKKIAR
ncbi:MAG: DUF620 domain-containing protein [Phycisphaerae bacterium]